MPYNPGLETEQPIMAGLAVSGGGIAGLAAALGAARAGHDITLLGGSAAPNLKGSCSVRFFCSIFKHMLN